MFAKWAPSELFSYFCPPPLNRPKVENKLCFQPEFSPLERKTGLKRSEIEPFCRWPANLLCGDRQNRAFDAVPPSFIPTTVRLLTQPKNPSAFKQKPYQVLLERFPISKCLNLPRQRRNLENLETVEDKKESAYMSVVDIRYSPDKSYEEKKILQEWKDCIPTYLCAGENEIRFLGRRREKPLCVSYFHIPALSSPIPQNLLQHSLHPTLQCWYLFCILDTGTK